MTMHKLREDAPTRRMIDHLGDTYQAGVQGAQDAIEHRRDQLYVEIAQCEVLIDSLLADDPGADKCTGMYTLLRGFHDTLLEFFAEMGT